MKRKEKVTQNNAHKNNLLIYLLLTALALSVFTFPANHWLPAKDWQSKVTTKSLIREWNFKKFIFSSYPVKIKTEKEPVITAKTAVVVDPDSQVTLLAKNPDLKLPPASLTKLATALVTVKNCPLQKVITVTETKVTGTKADLVTGDLITVEGLLYALLLPSGNDAAQLLSLNCANVTEQFVDSMNSLARQLGMDNTHFSNPTGLDSIDQYSTAKDLTKLAEATITDVELASIVSTPKVKFDNALKDREYHFVNLNRLLTKTPGVLGIKTGTTESVGENLITLVNRENKRILTVVLGSTDRFGDSQKLIEWTYSNYDWISF